LLEDGTAWRDTSRVENSPASGAFCAGCGRRKTMLYTLAVILLILWLLGLVTGYTIGAFIHVLLVVAVVLFLVGLLSGRRVV
jgi:hypothetical protein